MVHNQQRLKRVLATQGLPSSEEDLNAEALRMAALDDRAINIDHKIYKYTSALLFYSGFMDLQKEWRISSATWRNSEMW